jgi:hypothetical protein
MRECRVEMMQYVSRAVPPRAPCWAVTPRLCGKAGVPVHGGLGHEQSNLLRIRERKSQAGRPGRGGAWLPTGVRSQSSSTVWCCRALGARVLDNALRQRCVKTCSMLRVAPQAWVGGEPRRSRQRGGILSHCRLGNTASSRAEPGRARQADRRTVGQWRSVA